MEAMDIRAEVQYHRLVARLRDRSWRGRVHRLLHQLSPRRAYGALQAIQQRSASRLAPTQLLEFALDALLVGVVLLLSVVAIVASGVR